MRVILFASILMPAISCQLFQSGSNRLPSKAPEKKYIKDGIIETYYEELTMQNEKELQKEAGKRYEMHGWNWKAWDGWKFRKDGKFKEGDRLWYFSTDPDSWKNLAGRLGFCVKRGEEIIAEIIILMN